MSGLLKLILVPGLLGSFWGLNDLLVSSLELTVHVGDPAWMGCVHPSAEGRCLTKVDWLLSSGEPAKEEYVLYYYSGQSVPVGRFQSRVYLVGDSSCSDGSLLLQSVEEADQGTYTCEIRLEKESRVFKETVVLHVLPEEPKELTVHVGDSVLLGCAFQSIDRHRMTSVDWVFSPGRQAQEEVVLLYYTRKTHLQYSSRFQGRMRLARGTARSDASVRLHDVRESDAGSYTCTVHVKDLTFRKTTVLHVTQREPRMEVTPVTRRPETLGGNHLVTIVGIVCATVLLLPVLILVVKRTYRNRSAAVLPSTLLRSLENTQKVHPEKHVYSSITTREVMEEQKPSENSESAYMTMHPVWPSLRLAPSHPLEGKSAGEAPNTGLAF